LFIEFKLKLTLFTPPTPTPERNLSKINARKKRKTTFPSEATGKTMTVKGLRMLRIKSEAKNSRRINMNTLKVCRVSVE